MYPGPRDGTAHAKVQLQARLVGWLDGRAWLDRRHRPRKITVKIHCEYSPTATVNIHLQQCHSYSVYSPLLFTSVGNTVIHHTGLSTKCKLNQNFDTFLYVQSVYMYVCTIQGGGGKNSKNFGHSHEDWLQSINLICHLLLIQWNTSIHLLYPSPALISFRVIPALFARQLSLPYANIETVPIRNSFQEGQQPGL